MSHESLLLLQVLELVTDLCYGLWYMIALNSKVLCPSALLGFHCRNEIKFPLRHLLGAFTSKVNFSVRYGCVCSVHYVSCSHVGTIK